MRNAKNFGLVMVSLPFVRPSVRTQSDNANRRYLFGGKFRGQLKNTKYKLNLYVFVRYVDKRGKKRLNEKENKKQV